MPFKATETQARRVLRRSSILALIALAAVLTSSTPVARNSTTANIQMTGETITPVAVAEGNFADLAARALPPANLGEPKPLLTSEMNEEYETADGSMSVSQSPQITSQAGSDVHPRLLVAGPSPSVNYPGLDDIAMVDSNYIIIPPDVAGGVGPTKVMESFNNNYRIRDKATGATQLTMGTATFWAAVTAGNERLALTDPRTTYDPYNNRWIVAMQTTLANGSILVGVSQTSDPAGGWLLYKFNGFPNPVGARRLELSLEAVGGATRIRVDADAGSGPVQ